MKNKGTIAALAVILVAGIGLYFAYVNKDIQGTSLPATTSSTAPEIWGTFPLPTVGRTDTARTTKKAKRTTKPKTTATTAARSKPNSPFARTTTAAPTTKAKSNYPYDYPGIAPAIATAQQDKFMICVNRSYALPSNYQVNLAVAVPSRPVSEGGIQMEKTAAAQYQKMYDAGRKAGVEIVPYSGYRATSRQKSNFDNKIASYVNQGKKREEAVRLAAQVINPPGCSEHEAGLAMDVVVPGKWGTLDETFAKTKEYTWLMAHAQEYGFILRYPKDKESVTKVGFEPWHWRYVGIDNAKAIKASGKCLEEYLNLA